MRISNDRSALGAAVVAMAHLDDFQKLGATDIDADAIGIAVSFGTAKQANVAHELVNTEFTPDIDGSTSRVPFQALPAPDGATVGWTDATAAIALLKGVKSAAAHDNLAMLYVATTDAKSAARIDALLKDRILGLDVVVEEEKVLSGDRGWGDGIG